MTNYIMYDDEIYFKTGKLTYNQKLSAKEQGITETEYESFLRRVYDEDEYDVSIIIPVYNGEKYILESINSALSQSYKKCEVIVVNDGSTDNTNKICQNINNITYYNKINGGTGSALNTGIRYARGKWIKWLSADDVLLSNAVAEMMSREPKEDTIYYTNYHYIDEIGNVIGCFNEPDRNHKSISELKQEMMGNFYGNGSTSLIHSNVFKKIGMFAELPHSEDLDFWLKALSNGIRLEHLPIYTLLYRLHDEQLTKKVGGSLNDFIRSKYV